MLTPSEPGAAPASRREPVLKTTDVAMSVTLTTRTAEVLTPMAALRFEAMADITAAFCAIARASMTVPSEVRYEKENARIVSATGVTEGVSDGSLVCDVVGDGVPVCDAVGDGVSDVVCDDVGERDTVPEMDTVGLVVEAAVTEIVVVGVGELVTLTVEDSDGVEVGEVELDGVTEVVGVADGVVEIVAEFDGDVPNESEGVGLTLKVGDAEIVDVNETVGDGEAVLDGLAPCVSEHVQDGVGVCVVVGDCELVGELVGDEVVDVDGVGVAVGVDENDGLGVALGEGEPIAVRVVGCTYEEALAAPHEAAVGVVGAQLAEVAPAYTQA